MLTLRSRAIAVAAAAAFALTSFGTVQANAGSRQGDAIAAAAIIGLFGTVAAIAAANARDRHYYREPYAAYPGGDRYYGRPVHPGHRGHGWHRHPRHY